jgi:hypothetical protein
MCIMDIGISVSIDESKSCRDLEMNYRPLTNTLRDHFGSLTAPNSKADLTVDW